MVLKKITTSLDLTHSSLVINFHQRYMKLLKEIQCETYNKTRNSEHKRNKLQRCEKTKRKTTTAIHISLDFLHLHPTTAVKMYYILVKLCVEYIHTHKHITYASNLLIGEH